MTAPTLSPSRPGPPADLDRRLRVISWPDPVVDEIGHDPRSAYAEQFWLPILGPSTTWLLRRLVDGLDRSPEGFEVDLRLLAGELGIALRNTTRCPLLRSLDRACTFGAARELDVGILAVRARLAPLTARQAARLPEHLQVRLQRWRPDGRPAGDDGSPIADQRARARSLALSMLELGEASEVVERRLHAWRLHPAVVHDALRWATAQKAMRSTRPGGAA